MVYLFVVLVGLTLASFIGSLAYRVPRGISIAGPRSFCVHCGKPIAPCDLVPVLSYLLLRGRCRSCGGRIPLRYPLVETALPLVYLLLYLRVGARLQFFTYAYLASTLVYLSLVDIEWRALGIAEAASPAVSGLALLWLSYRGLSGYPAAHYLSGAGAGTLLVGLSFLAVYMVKKRTPMGAADFIVVPAVSLSFGLMEAIRVLIAASLCGAALGTALIAARAVPRGFKFPLVPFLAAGVLLEVFLFS